MRQSTDARSTRADALVGEIGHSGSGKLTIFLGAAPGVGKTFAMLSRARELLRQGSPVLAGVVETHGRVETAALLEGIEVQPMLQVAHRGRTLPEMDLDALLARKPPLVLVDELAHRNAPGSRHERRWQDVAELLDAGIDVYTTINIQHLESLNDVVHRITGVRVAETVPDKLFDRLRDIVLVDLPPRELVERLRQGKVYVPEQASQALQAFFSLSNLAALRELAMQTAADRVDNDLRATQVASGLPGVPLRRGVLVAIDGRGQSEYMVRIARRLAERRDAPWTVVSVQVGADIDAARQKELDGAFALARRLGGQTVLLHGDSVVDALLDHAGRNGVSAIVLGRTRERRIARMFNRTLTQQLIQRGAHFELTIVNTPEARARARRRLRDGLDGGQARARMHDYAVALVGAALATGVAALAERLVGLDDLSMIFIVAVLLVASRTRTSAAVLAALLCFFAYNFFFIDPRYTLLISARQGVTTVVLFLLAALVAGRLAARLRAQVVALRAANAQSGVLQALGRQLATAADRDAVVAAGKRAIKSALDAECWIGVGDDAAHDGDTAHDGGTRNGARASLTDKDRAAADWVQRHGQAAGRFTDTLSGSPWWFLPLPGDRGVVGVLGIRVDSGMPAPSGEWRRIAEAMAQDIAQALERTQLVADLETARVGGETERLRSALLSSVSHDLRSPLASIIGAASSLDSYGDAMSPDDRHALLDTIRLEGERLDRYIQNLLDMTRLGHGGLTLHRDWIGVDELVGSAVTRLQRYQPAARFSVVLADGLPSIWVHPALVEQALFNVLENAVRFSPPDVPVAIDARLVDGALRIDVSDRGPGIPAAERARIFDVFYSVERGDRGGSGTGLGLTIAQGMVGAHGGSVEALPNVSDASAARPDDSGGVGTTIRITLPVLAPRVGD